MKAFLITIFSFCLVVVYSQQTTNDLTLKSLPTLKKDEKVIENINETPGIDSTKKWQFGLNAGAGPIFFVNKMPLYRNNYSFLFFLGTHFCKVFKRSPSLNYFFDINFENRLYNMSIPNLDRRIYPDLYSPSFIGEFDRKNIEIRYLNLALINIITKRYNRTEFSIGFQLNFLFAPEKWHIDEKFNYQIQTKSGVFKYEWITQTNEIVIKQKLFYSNLYFSFKYKIKNKSALSISTGFPLISTIIAKYVNIQSPIFYDTGNYGTRIYLGSAVKSSTYLAISYIHNI
jgi:hypothetical protein